METVFGINMVALQDGQPKLMSLKEMLEAFIRHRREVITRRTIYDLAKARDRAHILEGLAVALTNIDEIIALIKAAASPAEARTGLLARTWAPGVVTQLLERAGAISRARGAGAGVRPAHRGLPPLRGAGAGDPRHAPAPAHRS
jgi:DNA gyrase subunit A